MLFWHAYETRKSLSVRGRSRNHEDDTETFDCVDVEALRVEA